MDMVYLIMRVFQIDNCNIGAKAYLNPLKLAEAGHLLLTAEKGSIVFG